MTTRNSALVARLRENRIRFSEFQRIAADETITAAVAATMLGRKTDTLTSTQYAEATKSLPYLVEVLRSHTTRLWTQGRLRRP